MPMASAVSSLYQSLSTCSPIGHPSRPGTTALRMLVSTKACAERGRLLSSGYPMVQRHDEVGRSATTRVQVEVPHDGLSTVSVYSPGPSIVMQRVVSPVLQV